VLVLLQSLEEDNSNTFRIVIPKKLNTAPIIFTKIALVPHLEISISKTNVRKKIRSNKIFIFSHLRLSFFFLDELFCDFWDLRLICFLLFWDEIVFLDKLFFLPLPVTLYPPPKRINIAICNFLVYRYRQKEYIRLPHFEISA
jgi:hypothetical protein